MRYFGLSLPFGQSSFSTENMKYLTMEQIIEDIANIIFTIKNNNYFNIKKDNPWIINGARFSGTILSWFMSKYPKLVKGVIASSPYYPTTLIPKVSENLYDKIRIGGRNCRLAMEKMLKDV